jgi:hypothetical protein
MLPASVELLDKPTTTFGIFKRPPKARPTAFNPLLIFRDLVKFYGKFAAISWVDGAGVLAFGPCTRD